MPYNDGKQREDQPYWCFMEDAKWGSEYEQYLLSQ